MLKTPARKMAEMAINNGLALRFNGLHNFSNLRYVGHRPHERGCEQVDWNSLVAQNKNTARCETG